MDKDQIEKKFKKGEHVYCKKDYNTYSIQPLFYYGKLYRINSVRVFSSSINLIGEGGIKCTFYLNGGTNFFHHFETLASVRRKKLLKLNKV